MQEQFSTPKIVDRHRPAVLRAGQGNHWERFPYFEGSPLRGESGETRQQRSHLIHPRKPVRLADFRGKTVLLNFWATWCMACLAEIPDLIAFQKKLGDHVAILGVALDRLPDEHDHQPGEEGQGHAHAEHPSRKALLEKVARAVKARGINYPVLLDPEAAVGRRFDGGQLPTIVIIDAQGHLRRRFTGERSLEVFEAMIAQVAKPVPQATIQQPAAQR